MKCKECGIEDYSETFEQCEICLNVFCCEGCLIKHIEREHKEIKIFKCYYCKEKFINEEEFNNHIKTEKARVECKICKKKKLKKQVDMTIGICKQCIEYFNTHGYTKEQLKTMDKQSDLEAVYRMRK